MVEHIAMDVHTRVSACLRSIMAHLAPPVPKQVCASWETHVARATTIHGRRVKKIVGSVAIWAIMSVARVMVQLHHSKIMAR